MKLEYIRTLGSLDLKCSFGSMFMFAVALVVLALRFLLVKFLEAPFQEAFLVFGSFHSGFLNNFLSRLLLLAFCSLCA